MGLSVETPSRNERMFLDTKDNIPNRKTIRATLHHTAGNQCIGISPKATYTKNVKVKYIMASWYGNTFHIPDPNQIQLKYSIIVHSFFLEYMIKIISMFLQDLCEIARLLFPCCDNMHFHNITMNSDAGEEYGYACKLVDKRCNQTNKATGVCLWPLLLTWINFNPSMDK